VYHWGFYPYDRAQPPIAPLRQVMPVNGGVRGDDGIYRIPREVYEFSFLTRPEDEKLERLLPAAFRPAREERIPAFPLISPFYLPGYRPTFPQRGDEEEDEDETAIKRPQRVPNPLRRKKEEEDEDKSFYPPSFIPGRSLPPKRRERVRRGLPRVGVPSDPSRGRPRQVDWEKLIHPYRVPQPWEPKLRELEPRPLNPRAVRIYFPPSRLSIPVREIELEGVKQPSRPPALQTVPECRYREINLSGKLNARPCGDGQPREFPYSGLNFRGLEAQVAALSEKLDFLIDSLCDNPAIAATPEWWQLRPGGDRPQLILLFAPLPEPGQPRQSAKWQISVPHYQGPKLSSPPLPTYMKGNCMGRLLLKDGSAIIVNAINEIEARRVLDSLSVLVAPSQLEGAAIAVSTRLGRPVGEQLMVACYARYFANGQRSGIPDWYTKFG